MTRETPYKVGDVLHYGNKTRYIGIAILEEFDPRHGFTKYAWLYEGRWYVNYEHDSWWPGNGGQQVWLHKDPDKIWADYAAWRLMR